MTLLFLFSVLFGLSMVYQVFLLSRIHERWSATGDTAGAIVHGVASRARLITGAAAIIVVVFTGFATGQLVLPGDGLRHCDRARRDTRSPAARPHRHAPARRPQLVPAALARVAPNLQVDGHPPTTAPTNAPDDDALTLPWGASVSAARSAVSASAASWS